MKTPKHILDKVLSMDLNNLTEEEQAWLHKLKGLATALTGRLQLKHAKEEQAMQFKVTVIQVNRLVLMLEADTAEMARENWQDGDLISKDTVQSDVIQIQRAA